MKKSVVIVAGGKGLRMNKELPKQFISVGGVPILMRTIGKFYEFDPHMQIVLVLPKNQIEFWNHLCKKERFTIEHEVVNGGETRFHSVQNGLKAVTSADLVGVHDGVRPFVSIATIAQCFQAAATHGAAVPTLPSVESIRRVNSNGTSESCNRDDFRMVQTPQVFKADWLKDSYSALWQSSFTDDASVVEAANYPITLVDGNLENIKITSPFDLFIAEAILNSLST